MAGGSAPPPKQDELQPHPVKDQLPNVSYCITSPPPWRKFAPLFLFIMLCSCSCSVIINLSTKVAINWVSFVEYSYILSCTVFSDDYCTV